MSPKEFIKKQNILFNMQPLSKHAKKNHNHASKPLVTIITVVFNGEDFLEKTIRSIISHSIKNNLEYIVIDGGSSDNTLNIIKKYEQSIDYWISEKDNGIYDAMNKGIDLANGDWVNFMNAGDELLNIPNLNCSQDIAFVYGRVSINKGRVLKVRKKICFKDFASGMVVSHQSCFYRTQAIKLLKYDLKFPRCAEQLLTAFLLKDHKALYSDKVVAYYDTDGASSKNHLNLLKEKLLLNHKLGLPIYMPFLSYLKTRIINIRDFIYGR